MTTKEDTREQLSMACNIYRRAGEFVGELRLLFGDESLDHEVLEECYNSFLDSSGRLLSFEPDFSIMVEFLENMAKHREDFLSGGNRCYSLSMDNAGRTFAVVSEMISDYFLGCMEELGIGNGF